jgi:hypothetical protein
MGIRPVFATRTITGVRATEPLVAAHLSELFRHSQDRARDIVQNEVFPNDHMISKSA